ncbi:hypothetical protein MTR_4g127900 [Medicago truncatula]|uniref:Uncharacterized protein n=1 Tax=Medicago truncatula TaxID=3880 RepID=G7JVD7_MEDTR|nr:hypothetical protein MTR_4g127900 [Medicago truncatula]
MIVQEKLEYMTMESEKEAGRVVFLKTQLLIMLHHHPPYDKVFKQFRGGQETSNNVLLSSAEAKYRSALASTTR